MNKQAAVSVSGPPDQVKIATAAAKAALTAAGYSAGGDSVPGRTMAVNDSGYQPGGNLNPTNPAGPQTAPTTCGCNGQTSGTTNGSAQCSSPSVAGQSAAISTCLTTGVNVPMCPPKMFTAFTAEAPWYFTKVPNLSDFNVACAVAYEYFGFIATKCASADSVFASVEIGDPNSCCDQTQVTAALVANTVDLTITSEPGCEAFTPGLLVSVGFANNVSPGQVSFDFSWVGSDGCPASYNDVRGTLKCLGTGVFAVLFGCVEEQRLYPVIARLRNQTQIFPAGTVFHFAAGDQTLLSPVFYPDEAITIHANGPAGTTLTFQTLTWNDPPISCLYVQALGWQ